MLADMTKNITPSEIGSGVEQRFIASVSHEIRTPLNGILGMASLLAETDLTAAQADYVNAIRHSGARLLDLLNNVLDYARMDAAGIDLEPTDVDLVQLAQDVAELLSPRAHADGLDIGIRTGDSFPASLRLDDGRIRQILFNLVGNAIKFTETGGVLIDLLRENDSVVIRVIDSGPGLAQDEQTRLFDAFGQAQSSHRGIDGGVGLGLTIVKRLVDAMQGSIRLVSEPGWGACFEVNFPIAGSVHGLPSPIPQPTVTPLTVGLAGLSPPLSLSLSGMLTRFGHTAIAGEVPGPVDVWLADASIPPARMKSLSATAPLIVLIRPEDRSQIEALRASGSAAYLMRPVRPASLLARLNALQADGVVTDDSTEGEADETASATGITVLVADDNAVNALLATRTLEKAGYRCVSAATGAEALEAVQTQEIDLVLMDLRMPVMDGYDAMKQIRALDSPKASVPMIAISAEVNPDVERRARASGANAVASKPLDAQTLRKLADTWYRRRHHG
jgi:CheY-like chemotaxis protein